MRKPRTAYRRLLLLTVVVTLGIIMLGAYVRLSDAGLGCPDWPGCYGHLAVPEAETASPQAQQWHEVRPLEPDKAWKEMVHRYFASGLGLLIIGIAVVATRLRRHDPSQPLGLPWFLVGLVIFQGLLGMWTVTLLLKPLVVMAHLLGGLTVLGVLWWLYLRARNFPRPAADDPALRLRGWVLGALAVVGLQTALGGWTSANYAALACPDFPTCQTQWVPPMDFGEAFVPWRGIGIDYEGGVLHNDARVAVHMSHRIGAVLTLLYVGTLGLLLRRSASAAVRRAAGWMLAVLVIQLGLGISNVVLSLPLPVAVAHNGGAAVLLLTVLTLNYALWSGADERRGVQRNGYNTVVNTAVGEPGTG